MQKVYHSLKTYFLDKTSVEEANTISYSSDQDWTSKCLRIEDACTRALAGEMHAHTFSSFSECLNWTLLFFIPKISCTMALIEQNNVIFIEILRKM